MAYSDNHRYKIDRETIERILDSAKIEEVVGDFVTLKRRGVNLIGLCPFHNEKTPSFTVSPAKNLCKCFGCGKGGNPVHFIMEHEQLSYYEALRWLAKKYHIEIKEREMTDEEKREESIRESLFVINQYALQHFIDTLHESEEGKAIGLSYFRHRGLRDETIKKFCLGYSFERRDSFAKKAVAAGYKPELIAKTGVCYSTDDGRLQDRFWGRVIFPVHTISGKIVAFGGRILQNNAKAAKYVNSPESEIYHKSDHLYGLYFSKQAIIQKDHCILVEGYLDVISMHQAGIQNVVASSGTSLTTGQIKLIHRFTKNITLLYDGDKAGIKASIRGIDMLLEEDMNINVVLLPEGEDPDSYSQTHSTEEVEQYIERNKVDFIRFKTNLLLDEVGEDPIRRAGLVSDVVKSIAVVPNEILRSEYVRKCSEMLNITEQILVKEVAKLRKQKAEEMQKKPQHSADNPNENDSNTDTDGTPAINEFQQSIISSYSNPLHNKERAIIEFLLKNGSKMLQVPEDKVSNTPAFTETVVSHLYYSFNDDGIELSHPLYKRIFAEAGEHANDTTFDPESHFMAHPDVEISRLTAELCGERHLLSKTFAEQAGDERNEQAVMFEQTTRLAIAYKQSIVDEMLKETMNRLKDPATTSNPTALQEAMEDFKFLKETQGALNEVLKSYGFGNIALNS
ncbi:MAG: DNA primase [Bacteroidaceae bacterium]|nr:DNA primase [Bacteroidaceae bacterium]